MRASLERLGRWWPHIVACFVIVHVTSSCIDAIPDLGLGLNRRSWQEPRVRFELNRWAARLGVDRQELEDTLFAIGVGVQTTRTSIEKPVKPYLVLSGDQQSWAMFVAGTRARDRFQIRSRSCPVEDTACDWDVLYTRNDHDHAFLSEILDNARVRSAIFRWGWPQSKRMYQRGCRAVAARVFASHPDATATECRFERATSPGPDGVLGTPEWGRALVVRREDLETSRGAP